jgi:hypothetical protein
MAWGLPLVNQFSLKRVLKTEDSEFPFQRDIRSFRWVRAGLLVFILSKLGHTKDRIGLLV